MPTLSDIATAQLEKFLEGFQTTWEGHTFQAGPRPNSFYANPSQPCALTRIVTDSPRCPVHEMTSTAPPGRYVNTTACHQAARGSSPFCRGLSLKFK